MNSKLPDRWVTLELTDVAKWGSGGTPKSGNPSYYGGDIPWAVIGDLNDGVVNGTATSITQAGVDNSSAKIVPEGTLLLAMYGSIGKLGITGRSMATNQAIAFARPDEKKVETKYLFFYLLSQRQEFLKSGKGATQQNISQTLLKPWPIPVAPLDEQAEIVRILEEQFSRLDAAAASIAAVRRKADQFRRSLLHAAFTGGITQLGAGGMTEVQLPAGWSRCTLSDVADITMGQSPPSSAYNDHGVGLPFFQGKAEFGQIHPTVKKWTTEGTKRAYSGDILMSVRAPVGPTNIADTECVIGRGLAAIRAREQMNQTFLLWFLRGVEGDIASRGTGTTFDSISGDSLRKQPVYVPPLPEQNEIVRILEEQFSRHEAILAAADEAGRKDVALRRSLLHAAFSGELTKEWRENNNG